MLHTIADVAKEAGVSVATVSRVLNQNGIVSEQSQKKVFSAIEKLNYHPNAWGRSLRRGESRILLVLIPNIANPYYAEIVRGIEDLAKKNGYRILLSMTEADESRKDRYLELLRDGNADGVIVMDATKNDRQLPELAGQFPIVQCCEYCSDVSMRHVSIDNFTAAYDMVSYLCSLGHKKIGFIGSTNQFISTEQRRLGYIKALQQHNLPVRENYLANADNDYHFASGLQSARRLLLQEDRPTALFCISDVVALSAIQVAKELHIAVPDELTVSGFDDVEYASMFSPKLTTVSQPCYELGETSCRMLLEELAGNPAQSVFLKSSIIVRESSAEVPKK